MLVLVVQPELEAGHRGNGLESRGLPALFFITPSRSSACCSARRAAATLTANFERNPRTRIPLTLSIDLLGTPHGPFEIVEDSISVTAFTKNFGCALATPQVRPTLILKMSERPFLSHRSSPRGLADVVNMYQQQPPTHSRPFTFDTTRPSISEHGDSGRVSRQWQRKHTHNVSISISATGTATTTVSRTSPSACSQNSTRRAVQ